MIDFEAWKVDPAKRIATHESGYKLVIEGSLKDPSAVSPGRVPEGLTAHDQVKLLRMGLEALANCEGAVAKKPVREAYQRPANLARKPLLTLKKRK